MPKIQVGKNRALKNLADAVNAAANGDTLVLDNETFAGGIEIGKNLVFAANDGRPVIEFNGAKDTHAIKVKANCVLEIQGIDFKVNAGAYCFNISGAVKATDCNVLGGGGAAKAQGATGVSTFKRFNLIDALGNYGWLFAGKTVRDDAQAFVQQPGEGVELLECKVMKGVVGNLGHVIRTYNQKVVRLKKNNIVQSVATAAAVRIHDGATAELEDNVIQGDCNFGPMGENEGGKNLLPGPKRNYFDKLSLGRVVSKNNTYSCNDFKINPGVLDSSWTQDKIADVRGGAVIDTPFPYMNRVPSKGSFSNVTFSHAGPAGRVFSDENGAQKLQAVNCTFAGTPFNH